MSASINLQEQMRREEPTALDLWIKRALKERYGRVAREKLPEELLRLLSAPASASGD